MIYFTHNFPFPARGSPANGLSVVLFKTLTVEGGSDISAPRVTGRTGLNLNRRRNSYAPSREPTGFLFINLQLNNFYFQRRKRR